VVWWHRLAQASPRFPGRATNALAHYEHLPNTCARMSMCHRFSTAVAPDASPSASRSNRQKEASDSRRALSLGMPSRRDERCSSSIFAHLRKRSAPTRVVQQTRRAVNSPGGRIENSPAVHCRVPGRKYFSPGEETAESGVCRRLSYSILSRLQGSQIFLTVDPGRRSQTRFALG